MPRRRGGLFLPLDVNFMEDDRIVEAGEKPAWLYLAMCLAAKRLGTDGRLTARQLDRLHVPQWRLRLEPLVALQLVHDLGADLWGIAAWYSHNDPQVVVAERRAKDNERKKRGGVPSGIRSESGPIPRVERSREEKREVDAPSDATTECPHGHLPGKCLNGKCRSGLRAVAS
jgi:hypothetical protein